MDIYVRKKMDIRNININKDQKKNIIQLLQNGSLKLAGQALRGSNSTFLCDIFDDHQSIKAIYKPSKGEQPLWDFPHFTLAQREVATFIVSELLGWHFVPPTILRTKVAIFGQGSLQLYIDHDPTFHYLNSPKIDNNVFMKIAIFDLLINNADRKSSHIIFDADNKTWLIDHGLCFNSDYKHRTVIWEYAGLRIPTNIKMDVQNFIQTLESNKLRLVKKLKMLLSEKEFLYIIERGRGILAMDQFPFPEPSRRSYPWPPI